MIVLNLICVWFSWWCASKCETWGIGWWLNMIASALNGVIVLRSVL